MIDSADLPWLIPTREKLLGSAHRHHGLLVSGPPAIGKDLLGLDLATHMLCQQSREGGPCGSCQSCHLVSNSAHPDLHLLMPEVLAEDCHPALLGHAQRYLDPGQPGQRRKRSNVISVDSARLLSDSLLETSCLGGRKIALVLAADTLNRNAANAMLKVLEEPAGETLFILVTSFPYRLPATIHSRCIRIDCPAPILDDALAWLRGRHEADNEDLSTLLVSGLGPITIDELLSNRGMAAISTLIAYCMEKNQKTPDSLTLARMCGEVGIDRALRILQNLTLQAVRECVREGVTPAARGLFRDRGFSIRAFQRLGSARESVGSAVDEQLALEDICAWVCEEHARVSNFTTGGSK